MLCRTTVIGLAVAFTGHWAWGQACLPDQKPNPNIRHHEFKLDVPLGQTFVANKWGNTCKLLKTHVPSGSPAPVTHTDTLQDKLVTTLVMSPAPQSHQATQMQATGAVTGNVTMHQYEMKAVHAMGDPEDYLLEISPDPNRPSALNLNLGYGSARLDLSDLSIDGIHIQSAGADVILTYNSPNRVGMKNMWITGGMSTIFLRNLEMARAEVVTVENGMGETQIIVGSKPDRNTTVQMTVGAGSATLILNQDVPTKIVISANLFSNVSLPEGMIEVEKGVFVNLPYKASSKNAFVFDVELGIGEFSVMTFKQ